MSTQVGLQERAVGPEAGVGECPNRSRNPREGRSPTPAPTPKREPTINSAIYEGTVFHARHSPVRHAFRYPIFMPLFDLDELPELLDPIPLWSARRAAPARFKRSDYLGDPSTPLTDAARDLVAERLGIRPLGPVRMLANPRYLGIGINPVAFYFLYGEGDDPEVKAMIAEVTNTPWGESHSYALAADDGGGLSGDFAKSLHVSPFMPMQQSYLWKATEPGEQLRVSIQNVEAGEVVFEAGVSLRRREITPEVMRGLLFRYPPMTATTFARIYWNAVKLKLKGAPYFSPPKQGSK